MSPELLELCEAALEDRLTPEQRERLESLVLGDPAAQRWYVEYLHQHACLLWGAGQEVRPSDTTTAKSPRRAARVVWWALAASVLLAVGAAAWWMLTPASAFATLAAANDCRWEAGSLPTENGSRLGSGRLRLAEGLARLDFDNGTALTIEAPAELELVSPDRCVLHAGRLVAKVPPAAIGFQVRTPTALLIDQGTEFGVHVPDGEHSYLQVFNGLVDVEHRATGKKQRVTTGKGLALGVQGLTELEPGGEPPSRTGPGRKEMPPGATVIQITTAMGRGQDAYVQPIVPPRNWSTTLLLVKRTIPKVADWDRKAYLRFDLSPMRGKTVLEAELALTLAPTGMGFASEVPDATFAVYGISDEALDDWEESALTWNSAPANQRGAVPDLSKTVLLGKFEVKQGVTSGVRGISGPALVSFLGKDTNSLATLLIVRETEGSGRMDLVHGFASKRHPYLAPPTLKLVVTAP